MSKKSSLQKELQDTYKGSTLVDRAATTKLLYNYLEYVSPADVDGIKKAYVTVRDGSIQTVPKSKNTQKIASMYGKKATVVADDIEPMALISKISPDDPLSSEYKGFGDKLLRSALRRIVDEV